ncbi:MAG: NAAT family transporter [Phycisphaeraceae bacterium]|nr:NAAT family transporter [Phycisphaeraceae bacterium]
MWQFALTSLASVLFVVDPVGALPAYLVMTAGDDPAKRRRMALRAALTATIIMAVFAAAGTWLFNLFGLSMPAFQIAGGAILFLVAMDMIRARRSTQESPPEVDEGIEKDDVAITPLAVPMLSGPAALAVVATLSAQADDWSRSAALYGAIVVTGLTCYLTLRAAEPLFKLLGRAGVAVFSRVLGILLAGISVQFILDGLRAAQLFAP